MSHEVIRNRFLLAFLCFVAAFNSACSFSRLADLAGTYRLVADWGSSSLVLDANGTFHEEIFQNGKPILSVDGSWKFEDGRSIVRRPCVHLSTTGVGTQFEYCPLPVQNELGTPVIYWDPDLGLAYRKIKSR